MVFVCSFFLSSRFGSVSRSITYMHASHTHALIHSFMEENSSVCNELCTKRYRSKRRKEIKSSSIHTDTKTHDYTLNTEKKMKKKKQHKDQEKRKKMRMNKQHNSNEANNHNNNTKVSDQN